MASEDIEGEMESAAAGMMTDETVEAIQFFIEGVLTAALGIFGIFGNIVSIKVLSSPELNMLPTFRKDKSVASAFLRIG